MIAAHLVEQIEQLLAEGKLSQRKIARLTGVSRGTIGAIALGKRQQRPRRICLWEEEPEVPASPPQRCPDCGGMVYMPCRLCRTQKAIATMPALRASMLARLHQQIGPLGLGLKPVHHERYEEVRRWRREQLYLQSGGSAVRESTAGDGGHRPKVGQGTCSALADKQPVAPYRQQQAASGTAKVLLMNIG